MFGFIKRCFLEDQFFIDFNMRKFVEWYFNEQNDNQKCEVRPQIVSNNGNDPVFFRFSIKTNKCSGSCNNINNPQSKLCVSDIVKNLNVKVFNLIPKTNETRHIKWHKTFKCKCRLNSSVCNNKQRWNDDKCKCECEELIDKCVCDKGFIWNPSNCECECDKSCDVGEYLDQKDRKCKKRLIDQLVERSSTGECTENIEETRLVEITSAKNKNKHKYSSCTLCIVLFSIHFPINAGIGTYFLSFHWYLRKDANRVKFGTRTLTLI